MAADKKFLLNVAPEFASESTKRIQFFLDLAKCEVNAALWGCKADYACAMLAAHMLTMSNRAGTSGTVTSEKVGDLQRNYNVASSSTSGSGLEATSYGQEFLRCRKSVIVTPICVAGKVRAGGC